MGREPVRLQYSREYYYIVNFIQSGQKREEEPSREYADVD